MPQLPPRRNPLDGIFAAPPPSPTGDDMPPASPATQPAADQPQTVLDSLALKKKKPRNRDWEKNNPMCSYFVPAPLHEAARQVRADILSIIKYDDAGHLRQDEITVAGVATALMDYALTIIARDPNRMALRANPRSRGQMTVAWEAWETWAPPIQLRPAQKEKKEGKKKKTPVIVLGYRWEQADIDERIRNLAGLEHDRKFSPMKHAVPPGELVVRLFQIAIEDYRGRKFKLRIAPQIKIQAAGWETLEPRG